MQKKASKPAAAVSKATSATNDDDEETCILLEEEEDDSEPAPEPSSRHLISYYYWNNNNKWVLAILFLFLAATVTAVSLRGRITASSSTAAAAAAAADNEDASPATTMTVAPSSSPLAIATSSSTSTTGPTTTATTSFAPTTAPTTTIRPVLFTPLGGATLLKGGPGREKFGNAVALSANGLILAVGAPLKQHDGDVKTGHSSPGGVRVYELLLDSTNNKSTWRQLGSTLDGPDRYGQFGSSLALSSDGMVLAVGAPYAENADGHVHVFAFDPTTRQWNMAGSILKGHDRKENFGWAVDLSADGSILAVGVPGTTRKSPGRVRLYKLDESTSSTSSWLQLGQQDLLEGQADVDDYFGSALSLSSNGWTVAVGALYSNSNGNEKAGQVRVFTYNRATNTWNPLGGSELNGKFTGDYFGSSVALSANGSILAVGAPGHWYGNPGHVRVFELDHVSNNWNQLDSDLEGERGAECFGTSVALSANGLILAAGASGHTASDNLKYAGSVRYFEFAANNTWIQPGTALIGEASEDRFGSAVALSNSGLTLAVGAPQTFLLKDGVGKVGAYAVDPDELL